MEQNEQTNNQSSYEPVTPVEHASSKPSRSAIWLLLAVVVVVGILIGTTKMNKDAVSTIDVEKAANELCYYSATTTPSGLMDVYSLKLTLDGSSATGELATIPAEKDSMRGTLTGIVIPGMDEAIFEGTYANSAEGMNNIDERVIRFTDAEARIGYGETKQNPDGTYAYVDKAALNYSLTIPRVSCTTYDELTQSM